MVSNGTFKIHGHYSSLFRVPDDKCHMVLPEIEEEMEDEQEGQKLSLTSLLLGMMIDPISEEILQCLYYSESSNIVAHIGLGDLPLSPQDTRHNSLSASNDGGLSDNGGYGYSPSLSQGRTRPMRGPIPGTEAGSELSR